MKRLEQHVASMATDVALQGADRLCPQNGSRSRSYRQGKLRTGSESVQILMVVQSKVGGNVTFHFCCFFHSPSLRKDHWKQVLD
jgi:hypothetical protein